MHVAKGILTATGGKASHAAVVAREAGVSPASSAATPSRSTSRPGQLTIAGQVVKKAHDFVTINGTTGDVIIGKVPTVEPRQISGDFAEFMSWADAASRPSRSGPTPTPPRTLSQGPRVRRRGDRPLPDRAYVLRRPETARQKRILPVRKMILADDEAGRQARPSPSLNRFRSEDFVGIFEAMDGLPVTIRLLDPPLHEFLPKDDRRKRPSWRRSSNVDGQED